MSVQWEGQSFDTQAPNKQLWLRAPPFPGTQATRRQAYRACPPGNAGTCQCSPGKHTLRGACQSERGLPCPGRQPEGQALCSGPAGPGQGPSCGLRVTPLATLPEQGSAVCAWGVRGLFGTESKLMQNTVKALSCELLRRGHGGGKEYARP